MTMDVRWKIPSEMASAVPWFTPGISVAEGKLLLEQLAEANKKQDDTEQRWTFDHPELLQLPKECHGSVLVHGHRFGLVRFKQLLLACNGPRWANLPQARVAEIVDKACAEYLSDKRESSSPPLSEIITGLKQKKEDLVSITSSELEAYLAGKMTMYTKNFSEESQAAASYALFMVHRHIK